MNGYEPPTYIEVVWDEVQAGRTELLENDFWVRERTCENTAVEPDCFECSECLEAYESVDFIVHGIRYCPSCGARVVEE